MDEVAVSRHYKYMCSEPGQKLIRDDIAELGLDHVVEASCSPKMHEPTFRNAVSAAGMNPYLFEMVNIREHCSWVSEDPEAATRKAKDLIRGGIARAVHHEPLKGSKKSVNPKAMIVGGGIAGITAALKIANAGYQVYMVEREEIIGGKMAQFDKTFPTLDCSGCILTPKTSEVGRHPNIQVLTKSQVMDLTGFVGNFKVRVLQKPRYVRTDKCTGCGDCQQVCPIDIPSPFELGMTTRHPISRPFPQAIPNTYSILREGMPPCQAACPAGVNVQGYMTLTGAGKFVEALALIRERMPFASICGRICVRPCESSCKRGQVDAPTAICHTKRFLGDYEKEHSLYSNPPMKELRDKKVAVIGAGPGGLSAAYYLAIEGYQVTVFEKLPVIGGMLNVGIPDYRLPRQIIDEEVENIRSMNVAFRTGVTFGKDITIDDLEDQGYQAVFLSIGLHVSRRLGIDGESLDGVVGGIDMLRMVALKEDVKVGQNVVVIGGGNVAIDVARTAVRLGAARVDLVCLEARDEMPAWERETHEAIEEGVAIHNSLGPKEFVGQDGKVQGAVFKRCTSVFDENGAFRPTYDENELTELACDTAFVAIGQASESNLLSNLGIELAPGGRIVTDAETLATTRPGLFAGGDCTLGPATFVQAVAQGRQAALAIHNFLEFGGLREVESKERPIDKQLNEAERLRAKPIARNEMPELPPETRTKSFDPIESGFTEDMARSEGQRCLSCGLCCQCGECVRKCGPQAINLNERERIHELEVGAIVVATGVDVFDASKYPEYGYGKYPDVITNLQFERLCNASGPTGGKILRPSDGKVPQNVVFVQCVGSRDRAKGNEYCSKVCCMISAKQLSIFKHHNPHGQAYVFYIDNRAGGKGYEEFLRRAIEHEHAQYIRGRVAKVFQDQGRLVVRGENSLAGAPVEIEADLVVLATGLTPQKDHASIARALNLSTDKYGFFMELHPKLGPAETSLAGIYLAGGAQGPKDIPESVAQGGAAAAEALTLFSVGQVEIDPTVARLDERLCTGCKTCAGLCAYNAISFNEQQKVASINDALCQGCGTCAAACPVAAIGVKHYTPDQIFAQIEGILA
ncbi:MAG: FAD-dependent oxidoreductase [Desulfomonile tiedjei]|uniref:FAD-dependent oxidoreductase n=1 Tax=Desulfomonile tiedjei TaxID=2358 RepID=A0A9D6YYX5_9BACT|nr:FAD-dependent oxidoreductase [Desulfomonile tiedjei]